MFEKSRLDLSGRQTVARHVHNVVDTATDPVVAVVIATSAISGELEGVSRAQWRSSSNNNNNTTTYVVTLVDVQVGVHIALVGTPDGASHAGPGLLEGQYTLDVVATDLLTGDGVDDGGLDTEEGQRGTAGLGRSDTTQRSDHVRAGLGLPVGL